MKEGSTRRPRRDLRHRPVGGRAMASVMLATYPEVFAGGAVIAGVLRLRGRSRRRGVRPHARPRPRAATAKAGELVRHRRHQGPWPRCPGLAGQRDTTRRPATPTRSRDSGRGCTGASGADRDRRGRRLSPQRWRRCRRPPLIEQYTSPGMGHGIPLDPRGRSWHRTARVHRSTSATARPARALLRALPAARKGRAARTEIVANDEPRRHACALGSYPGRVLAPAGPAISERHRPSPLPRLDARRAATARSNAAGLGRDDRARRRAAARRRRTPPPGPARRHIRGCEGHRLAVPARRPPAAPASAPWRSTSTWSSASQLISSTARRDRQRAARADDQPLRLGLDPHHVERLRLAADLDPAALADGEVDHALVLAEHAAVQVDDLARRGGLGAAVLDQPAHNRRRGRSRCPGCRACRRPRAPFLGQPPDLALGQVAQREAQEIELVGGGAVEEIALVARRIAALPYSSAPSPTTRRT